MPEVPVFCNLLWSDQRAAQTCPRGDVHLAFCSNCGFIGNATFDPERLQYSQAYENSLDFSPHFQDYAKSLATRLVERHHLQDKSVIEIGCGKGDFLYLLCTLGNNHGIGFDPTYIPLPEHEALGQQFQVIQDYYSEHYANLQADFISCRHTLEHIPQPMNLLQTVRRVIGDRSNTTVFFEVPNALDTFRHLAIWDIIYEHCCYFPPVTLAYAFSSSGFQVHGLSEEYSGQFLCIEATPGEPVSQLTEQQLDAVKQLTNDIKTFSTNFCNKVSVWKDKLEQISQQGQQAVIWGGGSKGVMFLNLLGGAKPVEYVVDINPRKQGMYAAGTGQRIVPPAFLSEYQPDVVFVMNPIYENEIRQTLHSIGVSSEIICV